jgi:Ca2+-binding EF-hand superfamily protein
MIARHWPRLRRFACLLACGLGLLVPGGAVRAQTAPSPDIKGWVQKHDVNGDGKLDRAEFQAAVTEAFYFRDKKKVGYLTIEELRDTLSPEILNAVKHKDDGQITLQEYVNAAFRDFEAIDTDKDGLLTVEEIQIYIRNAK